MFCFWFILMVQEHFNLLIYQRLIHRDTKNNKLMHCNVVSDAYSLNVDKSRNCFCNEIDKNKYYSKKKIHVSCFLELNLMSFCL